jgi:hypothetical protein
LVRHLKGMKMAHKLHSGDARRYVRMAQMAGIALGVSAAALWALDVPGLAYREPARPNLPAPTQNAGNQTTDVRFDRERTSDIAHRLDLGVRKPPPPPARETPAEQPVAQAPPPPPAGPAITYIGPIYECSRILAVISVDGRQRIVPEGRSIGEARIVSVGENQIEVQDQAGRRTIDRGERSGSAVSWLRPSANNAAAVANNMGAGRNVAGRPGATNRMEAGRNQAGAFSPEMEQRFRERGIDPGQAQRWREALRERQVQRGDAVAVMPDASVVDGVKMPAGVQKEDADSGWYTETQETEDDIIIKIKRLQEEGKVSENGEILP